jgi:hypothetical protein
MDIRFIELLKKYNLIDWTKLKIEEESKGFSFNKYKDDLKKSKSIKDEEIVELNT